MPITDAFIIAAIVAAFAIFGAVLAWAEYQTRHLPRPVQQRVAHKQRGASTIHAKAA
jgi:multisubunit Na+/H+ antiporter MnhC subunit